MNISQRAVIRYHLGLKGLTPKEIHEDMMVILGLAVPSYNMVKKWAAEFIHGNESLESDPLPDRSVTVTTQSTIGKIHDIMSDRRVTDHYIAIELGIFQARVHAVIHNELHVQGVSRLGPKVPWT